jgi:hypothetical protein
MASVKMNIFWDVTPYSLVEADRRFGGDFCILHCPGIMEATSTSGTSLNFYQTARRNAPENIHLQS